MDPTDRPRAQPHPLDALVAWSLAVIVALVVAGVALWRPLPSRPSAPPPTPPAAAASASPTSSPPAAIVATARVPATPTAALPATPTPRATSTPTAVPATATPTVLPTSAPVAPPVTQTLVVAVATVGATPSPTVFPYVVRPGETLGMIAARYGTTIEALAELNDLADPDVIAEGQELLIPTGP